MGIKFEEGGNSTQRVARFTQLIAHPAFRCPENDVLATAFVQNGSPNFPATLWISYSTSEAFHELRNGASFSGSMPAGASPVQRVTSPTFHNTPQGYVPKITKIGKPSLKIYVADGGRFSTGTPPTMNLDFVAGVGGAYADIGAYSRFSRAWDRGKAPGNGGASATDPRILSYRHGARIAGGPKDSFKMNAGFFDGHVETLGDLQSANPVYWLPKGTSYPNDTGELYPDVIARYGSGVSNPAIVQE
jgi:prepilin-type processing-associated H-X9-DG protein